jgi:radical SAM protein with 4Fe4S-binding SPASM domain
MKLINDEIRIEPTNICNARCIMCPRDKLTRSQGIMTLEIYKNIVDQCISAGAKKISIENFGEPFIDPYIIHRAKYAKEKGLQVLTITNASLLTPEKCEQAIKYFDTIRISMYGMNKDTYEKIHVGLSYETLQRNLESLFLENQKQKNKTQIIMYFLLMEENKDQMQQFIDTYEKKCSGISVWKPHNWIDGRCFRNIKDNKVSCGRPQTGPLQVQWNGKVVPCCYDYDSKMILGDFTNQTLKQILKSKEYNRMRDLHNKNDFSELPVCQQCDQLNKSEDVLVYSNIKNTRVGKTNTDHFELKV